MAHMTIIVYPTMAMAIGIAVDFAPIAMATGNAIDMSPSANHVLATSISLICLLLLLFWLVFL